jgi:hypothetical protein
VGHGARLGRLLPKPMPPRERLRGGVAGRLTA